MTPIYHRSGRLELLETGTVCRRLRGGGMTALGHIDWLDPADVWPGERGDLDVLLDRWRDGGHDERGERVAEFVETRGVR